LNDIVLYCKSYRKDFLRLKRLLASIEQFNSDAIPFYISTPAGDKAVLEEVLGAQGYIWVADESIVSANPKADLQKYQAMPGGLSQQIVKSEFWRLGFAENYLCLDSDCVFIRPFYQSDFLAIDKMPYTVLHQNKELFQMASNRGHLKVERDLRAEAERVKALFGRTGPNYYCAPAPFIWSARVWESLDRECLQPKGITLWEFISPLHPETLIYGEALLKYQAIPIRAIEPLFRVYHYDWQYYLFRRLGETTEKLKQNFMGVLYQSNWEVEMGLESDKSSLSLILKRIKRFGRLLGSYF
jgi:hypothetical protein